MSKYIEAKKGNIYVLTALGLQTEFVREIFTMYPMYKHKVPAKWILNKYVQEVKEED